VLDAADPRWPEHLQVTRDTLDALGPGVPPSLLIFNKIDRVSPDQLAELVRAHPKAVTMNALDPEDLRQLRQQLVEFFEGRMVEDVLPVPVTDGRLHAEIRAEARILEERLDDGGTILHLRVRALPPALERWRAAV
jgi:GTP-binding protein HflX